MSEVVLQRQRYRYEPSAMHSVTASVGDERTAAPQQRPAVTPIGEIHYDHASNYSIPDEFGRSPLVREQNLIESSFEDKRWTTSSTREGAGRPKSRRGRRRMPLPSSPSPEFDQLILDGSERAESSLSRSRRASEEIVELPWQTRRGSEVACERPRTRHGARRRSATGQDIMDMVRMSPAVPSPPPTPQPRCEVSARQRRRRSTLTYEQPSHKSDMSERPTYTRSLSSSKFSVLPAIGVIRKPSVDVSPLAEPCVPVDPVMTSDNIDTVPRDETALPDEPSCDEQRLLLGIKLPNGKRVQRYFRLNDTLDSLLRFAESAAGYTLAGSELVCGTIPKQHFHDLQLTIESCQLKDKTVLHIQAPEMP